MLFSTLKTVMIYADSSWSSYWSRLTEAKLEQNLLEFRSPVPYRKPRHWLFIRSCYVTLVDQIFEEYSQDKYAKILITGTPGIGKSMFCFYVMYHLKRRNCEVVYQLEKLYYHMRSDGSVQVSCESVCPRHRESHNSYSHCARCHPYFRTQIQILQRGIWQIQPRKTVCKHH